MTTFERAWAFISEQEGGARLTDDPNDPGGLTKWGISQRAYPTENIRGMTEARAQELFRRDYWEPCQCDALPDPVAIALADAAFNQGVRTAIILLQKGLRVEPDGIVGPMTIAAARGVGDVNNFLSYRLARYAMGDPIYRRGWFLRVLKLKDRL